ncbi:MAG: metallophosphoesterase [Eubacteriaceae bacterium]|nr:metallophosphoesterase [Eubacteriaceae bacterium]
MKVITKILITVLLIVLAASVAAGCCVLYAVKIAPHKVTETTENISDQEVKSDFKIAVIADTHFGNDYTTEDFSKAAELVNDSEPDLILFLGDLFDDYETYGDTSDVSAALNKLTASKGKYAVFGNHDYGGGAENEYESIMKAGGFTVLKNETVDFSSYNITLTGVDDFLIGYGDTSCVSGLSDSTYNMIACHEPDVIDKMSASPVDLMLSGHTHGGQVEIPFYGNVYLPSLGTKYVKGRYDIDNSAKTVLYVNRGLGTTKIHARFLSSPEVTVINLKP